MEPSAATRKLGQRRLRLAAELHRVQKDLAEAIRRDIAGGVRQVDICKVTGYTRERVRLLTKGLRSTAPGLPKAQ